MLVERDRTLEAVSQGIIITITDDSQSAGARQIAMERGHIRYEIEALRKDGSTFINRYTASPVPDRDGKLSRYVTVNEDITDERKRDGRLAEMQKMESVGQLSGGIAHEFNNLLTIVRGNAEDLREELKGLQQRQADMVVQTADRGAARARRHLCDDRHYRFRRRHDEWLGTTVKLYFPPAADAFGDQLRPEAEKERPPGTGRILMVEDDDLARQSVGTKLLRLGYDVTSVPAAAEALAVLESDPQFDLLFTDVIMPGAMTGADLARDVARRWPSIRLLMTSGYTEATFLGKVKMPEDVRLLSKPYSNAELADAISTVLQYGAGPKAQVA